MNRPYREGYRDGLTLARAHCECGLRALDEKGVTNYTREQYGRSNNEAINSRKAGFRDGYAAGVDAAAIECRGKCLGDGDNTETGGDSG